MFEQKFDFYSPLNLKAYNLDQIMRYQLDVLGKLDPFTRKHSENVANLCCRICEYLRCKSSFTVHCTIGGYLHDIGNKMVELANKFPNEKDKTKKKALNQCAREVLLAQSRDWLFIITNGTMVDYAKKPIKDHVGRFNRLYDGLMNDKTDEEYIKFLKDISKKDCIFPEIDYMIYR